jgi:two-component system chemotaxis response regulator CheB
VACHDIIVIGASAGGVEALSELVRALPPGLPAALFVVCHFPADSRSVLPDILSRSGPLLAQHARDGEPINPGQIYIAPPDHHLLLEVDRVKVTRGPREHGLRPAIDPLFRSAARVFGARVVGVLLSGSLYDGLAGFLAIRAACGMAVLQDPKNALSAALPESAAEIAGADHIVSAKDLGPLLVKLVQEPVVARGDLAMTDPIEKLPEVQKQDQEEQKLGQRRGTVSVFTCPECGGSLWQVDDKTLVRFRCHVGHVYQAEALLAEQAEILEAALWTAVRTFKDRAVLSRQLANQERERGNAPGASHFDDQAQQAERYSNSIQKYLLESA